MNKIVYFYRRRNPVFFSIEQAFGQIVSELGAAYKDEYAVAEVRMPLHSSPWALLPNIRFARRRQGDINHITGDIHYILVGLDRSKPNVLTVHDCVLLQRLSRKDPRWWIIKWLWYDWPIRRADIVTAISENTKRDLLHFTKCPPDKIRVIPQFIDPAFRPRTPAAFREKPLILFVGTTENKNLPRLAQAMEGIPAELDIIGVVNNEQLACLKRYGIDYRQCSAIPKEELLEHFHDCDIVAFPSTYEGFGLPVIEGQAVGKPVMTSAISPMKEVAGEGAALVDPYDVASIRAGLLRIIDEKEYRDQLVAAGLVNAAKFSLRHIVDAYARLYAELLDKKSNPKKCLSLT